VAEQEVSLGGKSQDFLLVFHRSASRDSGMWA
jgi:hypothetical protein